MKSKKKTSRLKVNPTLEEIRHRCSKIQSKWSERERFKRSGAVQTSWHPPVVPMDDTYDEPFLDPARN